MSEIELKGLILNDLTLYNNIMETFYQKMSAVQASSTIFCEITFNNIDLKNSNNCSVSIKNQCFTNSFLSMNVLLETIIEKSEFIPDNIKKRIEKNLGIILDKDLDQNDKGFIKKCNISASVNNNINVNTLKIEGCDSKIPLKFNFYNTGDAKTNCGITELINALSKKTEEEEEEELNYLKFDFILNKVLNLTLLDYIYIIILLCIIINILFLIRVYISKPQNIMYKYNFKKN